MQLVALLHQFELVQFEDHDEALGLEGELPRLVWVVDLDPALGRWRCRIA